MRLEWIFGVPQIKTESQYRSNKYKYGEENVHRINDYAYSYQSTIPDSFNNSGLICLLERLLQQRGRSDEFCLKAVKDLMSLCLKDEVINKYIYDLPPPSFQYQRYVDWFGEYIAQM